MCILLSHLLYGIYISHLLKWTQHTNKTQLHFTTLLMKPVLLLRLHICVRFLNMSFRYKILSAFLYTNHYIWYTIIYTYTIWSQLCDIVNCKTCRLMGMVQCVKLFDEFTFAHSIFAYVTPRTIFILGTFWNCNRIVTIH